MTELLLIVVAAALVNNFVLVQFLGLCPFMGASRRVEGAIGLGLATGFVLTLASGSSHLVDRLLLEPFHFQYLRLLSFILVIGAAVGFALALALLAGLRERLDRADVPTPFRGASIAFVTAGILSLAFLGFAGFARL